MKPENSAPLPQRGQRPSRPDTKGERSFRPRSPIRAVDRPPAERAQTPVDQPPPVAPSIVAPQEPQTYTQEKRNSHTTSTKCQYQAANSKPRCCFGVNWPA